MNTITFITGNKGKAEQLERHLNHPVNHLKLDLAEIQSLDLHEVVIEKAKHAYQKIHSPVLVEDTSLTFRALGKLPGTFVKFFLSELGNEGLVKILNGYEDRSAIAQCCFGYYDGKEVKLFDSEIKGTISLIPRGEAGFGWDPIFIPEGKKKTWAEMSPEEQNETSMRKIALSKLETFLKSVI